MLFIYKPPQTRTDFPPRVCVGGLSCYHAHTHTHTHTHRANVLFLKFNLDRRDRRKREYVLLEEGINDDLLGHLNSIVEQNQATLSVENKLEVSGRLSVGVCGWR